MKMDDIVAGFVASVIGIVLGVIILLGVLQ